VTVKIKYADFQLATRSRTFPAPVASRDALRAASIDLVRSIYPPRLGIRLLGVTVSTFEGEHQDAAETGQLGLDL
jgi:DNA polymerase IV